jgi:hypothetical protein
MSHIDDSKTIYTDDGIAIPWLNKTYENYLDKTTLIFGASNSGKSTIIEEILYFCKDYIPNVIVIAPRTSDKAYRKKLPARCIKEDLTKDKLQKIWDRQFYYTQVYNIANDLPTLSSLFCKSPDRQSMVMVQAIAKAASRKINEINQSPTLDFAAKKTQTIAIEESRNKKINILYKQTIRKYKSYLEKQDLSDKEKIALEYLDINPRLMLIIDDCSEKFKGWMKFFKKPEANIFESIFYKGRWQFITLIIGMHDDKLVDTELRKNSRVTIFTTSQALVASINKTQSGYTPQEKKDALKMAGRIFASEDRGIKTYQKFCYIREDPHPFRYTIANLYPEFRLGCPSLYELVAKMPKLDDNLENNPFLKDIVDDRASGKPKPKKKPLSDMQKRKPRLKYD